MRHADTTTLRLIVAMMALVIGIALLGFVLRDRARGIGAEDAIYVRQATGSVAPDAMAWYGHTQQSVGYCIGLLNPLRYAAQHQAEASTIVQAWRRSCGLGRVPYPPASGRSMLSLIDWHRAYVHTVKAGNLLVGMIASFGGSPSSERDTMLRQALREEQIAGTALDRARSE